MFERGPRVDGEEIEEEEEEEEEEEKLTLQSAHSFR